MNKKFYVGIYIASFLLAFLVIIGAVISGLTLDEKDPLINVISVVAFFGFGQFLIIAAVYPFVLLAKMWGAIRDGQARTTPGKAIGFLFIPFFNLYWIFQVWAGFPEDYNRFIRRHHLPVPPLTSGIFFTYSVLFLLSAIPLLGILPVIANLFLLPGLAAAACDAVNQLAETDRLKIGLSV